MTTSVAQKMRYQPGIGKRKEQVVRGGSSDHLLDRLILMDTTQEYDVAEIQSSKHDRSAVASSPPPQVYFPPSREPGEDKKNEMGSLTLR